MLWPNDEYWKALCDGERIDVNGTTYALSVIECGELVAPTGRIAICDPFARLDKSGNPAVNVSPGRYSVKVTLADVSGEMDGSHIREAYASLLLQNGSEVRRGVLKLENGNAIYGPDEEKFFGFGVDTGTACFVDEGALVCGMPASFQEWDEIFDNGEDDDWFHQMDDPAHLREGLANILLSYAHDGENIFLIHSGWGDGFFPIVGGYTADNVLTAIHIDFNVVFNPADAAKS